MRAPVIGELCHPGLDASIVMGVVQLPKNAYGRLDHSLHLAGLSHVHVNKDCLAAGFADNLHRFSTALRRDVGNHDPSALTGKRERRTSAYPGAAPVTKAAFPLI